MAEEEWDNKDRVHMLQMLHDYLPANDVPPTVWALLWIADQAKLEGWVDDARQSLPKFKALIGGVERTGIV